MRFLNWLARFVIGAVVLIVTLYFVFSVCVAYFKFTGRIVAGQRMLFDMHTPSWTGLLTFQAVCIAIVGVALFFRSRLLARAAFESR
jgi:hypothetical protein